MGLVTSSVATNLYVSSYAGTVTSLQLTCAYKRICSLTQVAVDNAPGTAPSWLEKDKFNSVVYSLDEGFSGPNGSISAFRTSAAGQLVEIGSPLSVVSGPVSSITFNGGKALAVAH